MVSFGTALAQKKGAYIMESNYIRLQQPDGHQIKLFTYPTSASDVLGNILILHGMAEHHERYLGFIQVLNQEGFDVYIYNHRGHGKEQKLSDLGFFAKKGGAELVINDAVAACHYIADNGRSTKLAVFGHSMGSLILRNVLQRYDAMNCAVVCASTMPPVAVSNLGIFVAELLCRFRGPKKQSAFLDKLLFGGKQYTSLCTRTAFDWLTRNNTIVGQYISDPYCGFLCTNSFYRDLICLSKWSAQKKKIAKTRKNLPICFLAGDKDPVGGYSAQIKQLHQIYQKLGFTDTSLIIYQDARHELLNELNAEEVMADTVAYLHKHLG